MNTIISRIAVLSLFLIPLCVRADMQEIGFSIQGTQLTWFEVNDPSLQGNLNFTAPAGLTDGNALAYDSGNNRVLFVDDNDALNHPLYSVNLTGLTFTPGVNQNVSLNNVGTLSFASQQGLFGADFYNGSYYALIQGTNRLIKADFTGTTVSGTSQINLPPLNQNAETDYMGDIAFNLANGDLYISGTQDNVTPTASNSWFWRYTTSDGGLSFTKASEIKPGFIRNNGMFFDKNGVLHGYELDQNGGNNGKFGTVDTTTGAFTETSTGVNGVPFNGGGDLSPGPTVNMVPEPSSLSLVGLGGLALLGALKRFRRQS